MTSKNPLRTRQQVADYALSLLTPLLARQTGDGARFCLGATSAHYPDDIAGMEAFSRPLWAIAPLLAGKHEGVLPLWQRWRRGLIHGVDPQNPAYWGDIEDYDQRMVEMASIAVGMCIAPDEFWHGLPPETREQLYCWLDQINRHRMGTHNWVFFRILVNLAFIQHGLPHSQAMLEEDLANVEAHYEGDGWYFDLPLQRDYYTPWAYHYYSLLYARIMRDRDPERCATFAGRSAAYAPQFAAWFDRDGAALPYGRSLTYRFAQGAFYASLSFGTDEPGMPWGEVKGLWLRNLRWWAAQPMLTGEGILSIGYAYPNLRMAENYNAPGSPYWAMKAFIALALPPEHPFWQAAEAPFTPPRITRQPHARLLITRDEANAQAQAYTAGNHAFYQSDAKYEKFAYSTAFAFSVARSTRSLEDGAFDSMLALSDDNGMHWRVRYGCESYALLPDRVLCVWKPYPDVTIHTEIIPQGDWHIRRHTIESGRALHASEAAYAIAKDAAQLLTPNSACAHTAQGLSGIVGYAGYQEAGFIVPEPNTNLLMPRTILPHLRAEIRPGRAVLACAVLGAVTDTLNKWHQLPNREDVCRADMG